MLQGLCQRVPKPIDRSHCQVADPSGFDCPEGSSSCCYLGISIDTHKADAEIEAAKMRAERLRLETQRLREKNQVAQQHREWSSGAGINPLTGRRLGQ